MTYDHWKTTNPDDRYLGSAPQGGNPHDYKVSRRNDFRFEIADKNGLLVKPRRIYRTRDEADQALGDMIADDDADRRLHRNRHEGSEP